jgi:hypothetical protein
VSSVPFASVHVQVWQPRSAMGPRHPTGLANHLSALAVARPALAAVRSHADAYMAHFDCAQARAPRLTLPRGRARGRRSCGCACCFLVVSLAVMYRRSCLHDATSLVQIAFPFASGAPVNIVSSRIHSAPPFTWTMLPADNTAIKTTWSPPFAPARRADPLPPVYSPQTGRLGHIEGRRRASDCALRR